jgi:hypothetical protein
MIWTPDGYSDFDGINTITKNMYVDIETENGLLLKCSFDHKIQKDEGFIEAQYLIIGDYIKTSSGLSKVISHKITYDNITLYDPVNVVKNNQYYSNDIVSHNCEFLGSTNTVISPEVIEYLFTLYKEPTHIDLNGRFRIYEKPIEGNTYILGCDTAKGTGENDSVIQVLKIISMKPVKFEQVAVFQDDHTDVYAFADIIHRISLFYNKAHIMVENNAEGAAVVTKLWWDIETESLVNTGAKTQNLGIRATKNTKPKAVLLMKKLIEDECLQINDKETVEQIASFIEENNKFFGKDLKDDLISGLYWTVYIIEMDIFDESATLKSMSDLDKEQKDEIWGILTDIDTDSDNSFKWLDDIMNS